MMLALPFPLIDPILFSVGPIAIRWYGIAYAFSIILGWYLGLRLLRKASYPVTPQQFDDSIMWIIIGIVVGGRLGEFIFYDAGKFISNPLEILMTWKGGMSFHGGLIGVIIAVFCYCYYKKVAFLALTDILAVITPLGLFFGRIANFINGELFGRVTDVSWGVIFPYGGPLPRHPSQIYEALLEGLALFIILQLCWHKTRMSRKPGRLSGAFLVGYALFRMFAELYRVPDGIVFGSISTGQLLCLPFLGLGWFLLRRPVTVYADTTTS